MRKLLFLLLLTVINSVAISQLNIGGKPYSLENTSWQSSIPILTTPTLNMSSINVADIADSLANQPPRFGFLQASTANLTNSGIWKTLPSGEKIWQLKVSCPSSKSINFVFSQYHLPPYASLYIYNPTSGKKIGGFTSKNNKGTFSSPKKMTTSLIYGNNVILELRLPSNQQANAKLQIGNIVHGYRYIYYNQNHLKLFGSSGLCNVNINCPEGNDKQNQKRGIAMILINGHRLCTGSLINNTANDRKLYFLTANHCLQGKDAITNPDASDWLFAWDYEAPNCNNPSDEPPVKTTNGAIVKANNLSTDFALFELQENPYNLMPPITSYFNGWDRANTPGFDGYTIHHPIGDIKKVSTYSSVPTQQSINYQGNSIDCWKTYWVQTITNWGVTDVGSSGSPLFNSSGKIIGQLYGGNSKCNNTASQMDDYFGRFLISWNNSTDNRRRLKDWLDPSNSNSLNINGIDGLSCSITNVDNQTLDNPPLYQDCSIYSANTIVNSGSTIFQVSKTAILNQNFEVKDGAEFEVKVWQ
jgi:lysyl endopeptidase